VSAYAGHHRYQRPAPPPPVPVRLEDAPTAPTPARTARAVDRERRVLPGVLGDVLGQLADVIRTRGGAR